MSIPTPALPQWHVKSPGHFCHKCKWQATPKHAHTLDPTKSEWADYADVQAQCGNLSGNDITRNASGNTRPQSSQLAEPLWTDPGLKSGPGVPELISTHTHTHTHTQAQAGSERANILPKSSQVRKKPPPPPPREYAHYCLNSSLSGSGPTRREARQRYVRVETARDVYKPDSCPTTNPLGLPRIRCARGTLQLSVSTIDALKSAL